MEIRVEMAFSLTKVLFYCSIAAPYLLLLLVPRTTTLAPLEGDFLALLTLVVTSLILAVRGVRRQRNGWGLLYPVGGLAAVVLFFLAWDRLQQAGDCLDFCLRQSRMEAHLGLLRYQPAPADTLRVGSDAYSDLSQGAHYDVQPPGVLLCTTGGEVSNRFWGYAYSPADVKPRLSGDRLSTWTRLTGHWYRWERPD